MRFVAMTVGGTPAVYRALDAHDGTSAAAERFISVATVAGAERLASWLNEAAALCAPAAGIANDPSLALCKIVHAVTKVASAARDRRAHAFAALERLTEERWQLMNSFGRGALADGRTRERIAQIDRELETLP